MRVPRFTWNRTHNLATLVVSFGHVWHREQIDDAVVLGYNAVGRLARLLLLDPASLLPPDADVPTALRAVRTLCEGRVRAADLAVIDSALERAPLSDRRH